MGLTDQQHLYMLPNYFLYSWLTAQEYMEKLNEHRK